MGRDKTLAQARPSVRWPDLRVAIEEHVQMAADLPGVSAGLGRPPAAGWPAVPAPHLRYLSLYPCRVTADVASPSCEGARRCLQIAYRCPDRAPAAGFAPALPEAAAACNLVASPPAPAARAGRSSRTAPPAPPRPDAALQRGLRAIQSAHRIAGSPRRHAATIQSRIQTNHS